MGEQATAWDGRRWLLGNASPGPLGGGNPILCVLIFIVLFFTNKKVKFSAIFLFTH